MNEYIELHAADGAYARIRLCGAHLTHWHPAGDQDSALFLSKTTQSAPGTAIRGGVPVIFPQFGSNGPLAKHGFARTTDWTLARTQQDEDGGASALFQLTDSAATRSLWPHSFLLELQLHIVGQHLQLRLDVTNTGATPFTFTAALHTYLQVADIAQVRVQGLQGLRYIGSGIEHRETAAAAAIEGEVDRIYFDAPEQLFLLAPPITTDIRQKGFTDTVVWNPGAERAPAFDDLEPGGWRRMLCVESAAVGTPIHLAAGAHWSGEQTLSRISHTHTA